MTVTPAPFSRSPVNAVACGCHSLGSTLLSQNSAFSSRSVPGMREVNPTSPCAPGGRPVPSELRLVAVVDGTPAVPGAWVDEQRGEVRRRLGVPLQQPGAQAVDQEHDVRRRLRQHQRVVGDLPTSPGRTLTPIAAPTAGTTSASERDP